MLNIEKGLQNELINTLINESLIDSTINDFEDIFFIDGDKIFFSIEEILDNNNCYRIKTNSSNSILDNNLPLLKEKTYDLILNGTTCIYSISGKLNKKIQKKDKIAEKFIKDVLENEEIESSVNFAYDSSNNNFAKIFILKKKN